MDVAGEVRTHPHLLLMQRGDDSLEDVISHMLFTRTDARTVVFLTRRSKLQWREADRSCEAEADKKPTKAAAVLQVAVMAKLSSVRTSRAATAASLMWSSTERLAWASCMAPFFPPRRSWQLSSSVSTSFSRESSNGLEQTGGSCREYFSSEIYTPGHVWTRAYRDITGVSMLDEGSGWVVSDVEEAHREVPLVAEKTLMAGLDSIYIAKSQSVRP
jgi:hypothetical protein